MLNFTLVIKFLFKKKIFTLGYERKVSLRLGSDIGAGHQK